MFGAVDIGIMLQMSFPDKKAAITAAFIARFGIGFAIGSARLPWPGWAVGLIFGLLLSIPDAHHEAYGPIIGRGAIGGTFIGIVTGKFGISNYHTTQFRDVSRSLAHVTKTVIGSRTRL